MPNYKIEGKSTYKGRPIVKITVYAGNEYLAKLKALDYMCKVTKITKVD